MMNKRIDLFRAEDFSFLERVLNGGRYQCAETANAKLQPLVEALESIAQRYEGRALERALQRVEDFSDAWGVEEHGKIKREEASDYYRGSHDRATEVRALVRGVLSATPEEKP